MTQQKLSVINDIGDTCDRALYLISEIGTLKKRLEEMKCELKICEERLCYDMLCLGQGSWEYAGFEQILNLSEVEIGRLAGRYEVRKAMEDTEQEKIIL